MKKNYEKFSLIIFFIILIINLEFIYIFILYCRKIDCYKVFNGIVAKNDVIEVVVSSDDLKLFHSNHFIYYDDLKNKFEIIEVVRNVYNSHHLVLIKCDSYNEKVYSIYKFCIFKKKINLISIFEVIWSDEINEKN